MLRLAPFLLALLLPLTLRASPLTLVISYDGFRWDYLERPGAAWFRRFAERAAGARSLVPCFPSKTYPNHYSLATGLYPAHHGLIANQMLEPESGAHFSLGDRSQVESGHWWEGEPLWVTAEKQGRRSACLYWPGSEAPIQGIRPSYWERYDGERDFRDQAAQVLGWAELPEDERPELVMLYFREPDAAGHHHGPESPEVDAQLRLLGEVTHELLLRLRPRLGAEPDVLLVSDHGMTATSPERVIALDELVDLSRARMVEAAPVSSLWPAPGEEEATLRTLRGAHPHLQVYARDEVPERFHFSGHRRIPPVVAVADPGWLVVEARSQAAELARKAPGMHGYDPAMPDMHGLFLARGPSFRPGARVGSVGNIHVYNAVCKVLGLVPARNDGSAEVLAPLFREGGGTRRREHD